MIYWDIYEQQWDSISGFNKGNWFWKHKFLIVAIAYAYADYVYVWPSMLKLTIYKLMIAIGCDKLMLLVCIDACIRVSQPING